MTDGGRRGSRVWRRVAAWVLSATMVVAGISGTAASASASTSAAAVGVVENTLVKTADLSKFQPGNIISDSAFFNSSTMSEAQIQSFLQSKVPTCQSGYTCLKDWYDTSRTTSADAMCGAYSGGMRERASTIIFRVAQACGINPQVLLVMLQKEQGLVLHTWPSDWRYTIAMGQGCPDTAACDTRYYGFFNQVYGAAWQMKRYANPAGTSAYFTWYAPGKTWNVRWHPDAGCGTSPVYIQNQATANLYYYTPYQPNAAALRAGYGEGDGCSSYGNRNFYQYFTDWFGSTQVVADPCAQPAASSLTLGEQEFVVNVDALNARSGPSTSCEPVVRSLSKGLVLTRTATFGDWARVRIDGQTYWVFGSYLSPAPSVAWVTSRVSGATRYETAVEVSKANYPTGASTVFVASGLDFPDALAAAPAAAKSSGSLLLTAPSNLPPSVGVELSRLAPKRIVIVGGVGAVGTEVEAQIAALVPSATLERVGGTDRYETSRLLADLVFGSSAAAYIATGTGFADALAASAVAGSKMAPVLLVDGGASSADSATISALGRLGAKAVVIAGGPGAVSAGVEESVTRAGTTVTRYGGADRYETSRLINAGSYTGTVSTTMLATGMDYPDSLVASVMAGRVKAPLFSQPTACMTGSSKDWMIAKGVTSVVLVGGTGALTDSVARSIRC